jgi:small subunit ribosomal protein S14
MKFKVRIDNIYRKNYYKKELEHKILNSLIKHKAIPPIVTLIIINYLNQSSSFQHFMKVKNRCVFTGRSRAVFSAYKISRIIFRQKNAINQLIGIKKSIW